MANLQVDAKNLFGKVSGSLKKQVGLLFWLAFLVVVVYEFFVGQQALQRVLWPEVQAPPPKTGPQTKLNFSDYDAVVKNITDAKNYQPEVRDIKNPFRPVP